MTPLAWSDPPRPARQRLRYHQPSQDITSRATFLHRPGALDEKVFHAGARR